MEPCFMFRLIRAAIHEWTNQELQKCKQFHVDTGRYFPVWNLSNAIEMQKNPRKKQVAFKCFMHICTSAKGDIKQITDVR